MLVSFVSLITVGESKDVACSVVGRGRSEAAESPAAEVDVRRHPGEIQVLPSQLESTLQRLSIALPLVDEASQSRRPRGNAGALPVSGLSGDEEYLSIWECRKVVGLGIIGRQGNPGELGFWAHHHPQSTRIQLPLVTYKVEKFFLQDFTRQKLSSQNGMQDQVHRNSWSPGC